MLYVLWYLIPVDDEPGSWVKWPDFSAELTDMFENFIQPIVVGICVIVIAWMIIMTLVQQPDRTDIIWATLKALGVALVGWFIYNLDDFVDSVVTSQVMFLLPLLRTLPLAVWWSSPQIPETEEEALEPDSETDCPDPVTWRT